jgi:hypothetical protein
LEFAGSESARIPDQFGYSGKVDKLRLELDSAFLTAIGIEVKEEDLLLLYHEIGSSLRQWIGGDSKIVPDKSSAATLLQWT